LEIKTVSMCRLVKGGDLNHHGTLFAGRGAEWFVEAGFIAAASLTAPESTVCVKIHGMVFTRPVKKGSLIRCESKVVQAGRTSLIAYVKIMIHPTDEFVVDGFLTFINVDSHGKPTPHGISLEAVSPEDIELQAKAKLLNK
jgi:acyl-CoA hydrolase